MRIKHSLAALLLTCGILPLAWGQSKPNVIVVMTDDQGYGDLSCHGNPLLQTPHLDQVASQSVRLTDFHVAPMCTPTRGQLMTGKDAFRNAAMNVSSGRTLLRPELKTMADSFRAGGYRTGIFGKWHLGDNYPFRPEDRGFDEALWFPSSHIGSVPDFWNNDYFDDTYVRNGVRQKYSGYCTDVFFAEAIDWIRGGDPAKPFFAYIPLNAPHGPHFVPEAYRALIRERIALRPDVVEHLGQEQRASLVSFLAMIANIDENVGKLDAALAANQLLENTILVFLTDNGSTLGEIYFNAGMRGKKTQLWEGGHRVPCFIRWPDGQLAARDVDGLCQVQDLLPTLADLAGLSNVPTDLDGQSLAPVLRGDVPQMPERMLVINYSRMPVFQVSYSDRPELPAREGAAVMWQHWRWLEDRQLYDLASDPHQDHDVAEMHPEVVQRMRAHLDRWWAGVAGSVMEPQRVVIGNERENPLRLTACEWLDVFVDQQAQIRRGERKNGQWHLLVDRPGTYQFELRRWPSESQLRLDQSIPATPVTDGRLIAGQALPISAAKIKVGRHVDTADPQPDGQSIVFRVELDSGPTTLETTLLDSADDQICGAYYVYVTCLDGPNDR